MGVDYNAFLGIGKRLDSELEVKDFLLQKTYLTSEQIECMIDGGTHLGMSIVCLDCYSGEDWFVGFEMRDTAGVPPDTLINNVVDAHGRWDAIFKIPPWVVHAVKIH